VLWRQRCGWEDNVKIDCEEMGHVVLNYIELAPCNAVVNIHGHIDELLVTT
jgi:hypothetical protein